MTIGYRKAGPDDYDFVRRVHHLGLREYVEDFFGAWDEPYQDERFAGQYKAEEAWIILRDGTAVGWLGKRALPEEIFLTELYVAPEHQNRGIGTRVLRDLIAEAGRGDKTVILGVMKNNPSRRLYEREGFEMAGENEYKYFMKCDRGGVRR